jgi:N-acyl homoserine lactone hydrolase
VIVVDTGETARTAERGYFPSWHPFHRFGVRLEVAPDEELGAQLRELGIGPRDVRTVVMTHLHTDHAGGLHDFANSEILVSRSELEAASGRRGRLGGYPTTAGRAGSTRLRSSSTRARSGRSRRAKADVWR